jgi:hypothetical protein
MLTAIIAFFQVIPAITGGVTKWTEAYYNAKVALVQARVGGDRDVAVAVVNGMAAEGQARVEFLKTVANSRFLQWMIGLWAGPWIIYEWKVVVWDNIVSFALYGHYGYTPEIKGLVAAWAGLILGGIFGTGGVMAAGQLFFNRRERS